MEKHKYVITLEEKSAKEAEAKKDALLKLAPHLSATEINALAKLLEKDPMKKELAKQYLGL